MNIGVDIRALITTPKTGVGEYTFELVSAILEADKKNNYFLFYNAWKEAPNLPRSTAENVFYIGANWPNKILNSSICFLNRPKLDTMIENIAPLKLNLDLFWSPNINFISLTKNIPFFLTIHDLSFVFFKNFYSAKSRIWHKFANVKKNCERADLIFTPSENTKRDIVDYFNIDNKKIKVIYPGVSSKFLNQNILSGQRLRIKYDLPDKFVLFLGTVEQRKNIGSVIDGFLLWQKKNSYAHEYSLLIAGALGVGHNKILNRIATTPKIKYLGYIKPEEKKIFYELAEVFIYPSFYEGFGLPVLEAMSVGTPVITSNRSSLGEVAGEAAMLVNPHDIGEIAKSLQLLTSDHYLYSEFVERGLKRAQNFSWQKAAQEWLKSAEEFGVKTKI